MCVSSPPLLRVRFQIIGNARIENVGKSQSCMVSQLPIIWKQEAKYVVKPDRSPVRVHLLRSTYGEVAQAGARCLVLKRIIVGRRLI